MKIFDPKNVSFGRHETFPLRFGWPTKGYRYWCESDEDIFSDESATVRLGVGKNMVMAIRYWLIASQLVDNSSDNGIIPSELGKKLLSSKEGWDQFLEDDTTIWLLHWLICSNPSQATTFFWFFNRYHKPEFTSAEASEALADFVKENLYSKTALTTLKHDIAVLLRMYAPLEIDRKTPLEETLDSPMTTLGLLQKTSDGRQFVSKLTDRRSLPLGAFGYAVLECMEARQLSYISLESLLHSDGGYSSPGSVFKLSEDGLITKLEELVCRVPSYFEFRETAGIRQFYMLQELDKISFLNAYYNMYADESAG